MSARTRFGSVYICRTFFITSSGVSDRWIVLPRLLLIFLSPSSPGSRAERRQQRLRLDQDVAPKKLLNRRTASRDSSRCATWSSPTGTKRRVVHRDVGGLQQRIAEEPDRRQILVLQVLLLLLVGRHALEPRHRHHHRQQQIELGVLGHQRLDEERALLRIEPGADPVGHVVVGVAGQLARCRRSRWSARASRRRSRSSRTGPAAAPSCRARPTRWPRCRRPVGRMPETTRALASLCRQPGEDEAIRRQHDRARTRRTESSA